MDRTRYVCGTAVFLCLCLAAGVGVAQVATEAPQPAAAREPSPFGPAGESTWNPARPVQVSFAIYEVAVGSQGWKDVLESERPVDALWALVERDEGVLVLGPTVVCGAGQQASSEIRVFPDRLEMTDIGTDEPVAGAANEAPDRVYRLRFTPEVTQAREMSIDLSCEVTGFAPVVPEVSAPSASFSPATASLHVTVTGGPGASQLVRGLFRFAVDPLDTGVIPAALVPVECFVVVTPSLDVVALPQPAGA